jgi:iron complex transport system substrate-binding protein
MIRGLWKRLLAAGFVAMTAALPASAQQRIVTLGGDVTEIVYALGAGDRIVATDSTSVWPAEAAETPKVGYLRQLSAEGVLSVEPDLIVISGAAGPPQALDQLRASGVRIVEMETAYSIGSIFEKIDTVAAAIGETAVGKRLAGSVKADWTTAQKKIARLGADRDVLFFATLQDGAPKAAGTETAAQGLVELLGAKNLFGTYRGYKPLSLEAAIAADPDFILVLNGYSIAEGTLDDVLNHPAISLTRAAQKKEVYLADPVTILQFGPRTPKAAGDLAQAILDRRRAADEN